MGSNHLLNIYIANCKYILWPQTVKLRIEWHCFKTYLHSPAIRMIAFNCLLLIKCNIFVLYFIWNNFKCIHCKIFYSSNFYSLINFILILDFYKQNVYKLWKCGRVLYQQQPYLSQYICAVIVKSLNTSYKKCLNRDQPSPLQRPL